MLNSQFNKIKSSYLDIISQKIFYYSFFYIFVVSCISMIVMVARSKDFQWILETDPTVNDGKRLFAYFVLYSQFIPIGLYGYLDLITLIQMLFLQKRIQKGNE